VGHSLCCSCYSTVANAHSRPERVCGNSLSEGVPRCHFHISMASQSFVSSINFCTGLVFSYSGGLVPAPICVTVARILAHFMPRGSLPPLTWWVYDITFTTCSTHTTHVPSPARALFRIYAPMLTCNRVWTVRGVASARGVCG
jgi:hypothetical protein